jgi:hypothetical protein
LGSNLFSWSSLRYLCVLGASAVNLAAKHGHRRGAEHAELKRRDLKLGHYLQFGLLDLLSGLYGTDKALWHV